MDELWYDKIDRNVDWGGDESTNNYPVAGQVIQDFIKSELNDRIGCIYHDKINGKYLCFAHEDARDAYLEDPTKTDLILGELEAPSSYRAEILLTTPYYNAILLGTSGNKLEFGYDIKNDMDQSHVDNINYNIVFTRNANKYTINGSCTYGKTVSLTIDEYLAQEGTTSITITITGQTTSATITTMVTYDVVNLNLTNDYNVATHYKDSDALTITYNLFGSSNIKYIEWYIDGNFAETDTLTGGTVEALTVTKYFSLTNYSSGIHNVQFRAYVIVNGEKFYTNTFYREFTITNKLDSDINITFETEIPSSIGIVNVPKIYNVRQYEPCTFNFGVYNIYNLDSVPVSIYINDVFVQEINTTNNQELSYTFVPDSEGTKTIAIKSGNYCRSIDVDVSRTTMNISELTDNLMLSLSAIGRSNSDVDKATWTYGDYSTIFTGFNWSGTSGWNNNRLLIGEDMSITTNIYPLRNNIYGKTLEFEFETINVIDDDAVICDVRNDNGVGLLLTASEASLRVGTAADQIVSTKFKSNENIRISFVINNETKMALIYINGVVSGAIKFGNTTFSVDKELRFAGSSDAGIKLKQILIYNTKLNSDQILNNQILYRDTVDEMLKLYDKNNILENALFSIDKISQQLPVMLLTGDINWLETQKDTDAQTEVDVEYINYNDPTKNFKLFGGCLRIQGTSSAGYPKKNYRLYTKRKKYSGKLYDYLGNLIESQKYSFKDKAVPVNCWCLKADYAESSGTHNTGVATMWNDVMYNANDATEGFVCRTNAQKAALENNYPYDVRTTVDGFPIVVMARQTDADEYVFIGKYNFNNDKSTENVFGFCDIPGFDDSKMQCWEMVENGNNYALFQTTEKWDEQATNADGSLKFDEDGIAVKNWASGFEARYPDDGNEADTTDLKMFADWLISCDAEKFYNEKKDHLDIWKCAAYYVYLMRFGAVDQVVKNSMFTTEDGQHWYYINYDNDTVLGLKNTGALVYPPTITRETMDGTTYAYAGHESRLWNMLENDKEFMRYVSRVDTLLYNAGLTYEQAIKYFNGNQSDQWCERIYNQDAEYKYITPSTTISDAGLEVNTLFMMQGSRKAHRTWWLAKRFKLMDGKFNNSNYVNQNIMIKLNGSPGMQIDIVAGEYMYYGCESNQVEIQMGVELEKGESYSFYKASATEPNGKDFAVGDPIYIYAPYAIEELDLSHVAKYLEEITLTVKDSILGTRLKKLIMCSLDEKSQKVNFVAGLSNATNLEYLDVRGLQIGSLDLSKLTLLKTLLAKDSAITSFEFADGCVIERLQLPSATESVTFNNLPNLRLDAIEGFETNHISKINISNCSDLTDDFGYYYRWLKNCKKGDELNLSGILWDNVNPGNLIEFKRLIDLEGKLNLKGKIIIATPTIEEVEQIQELFGEDCFTNNAALWVSAPESVFIHGPKEMRSGDSETFTTTIFSENPGTVVWEIESGGEFVESIISNPDNSGVLTTIEDVTSDREIVIKAIHKPATVTNDSYYRIATYNVLSKKTVYSTYGTILGNATIKKDEDFSLSLYPSNFNGDFTTEWYGEGVSFENNSIGIFNKTNTTCTVKYLSSTIFDICQLNAKVTNKDGSSFIITLKVTVTDESVLMTSTSNPEVMAICYNQGWAVSPDVMYKTEAQVVTNIGTVFQGGSVNGVARPGAAIKTFDELEEFKNIKAIPDQAFFQCNNLTSIKLPLNVEHIGSFALGSTKIKQVTVPNNVTSIYYTAFDGSPVESFIVGGANVSFLSKNGVLISADGELVKYPEGKMDEEYITDETVTKLGQWSIRNTKLKNLVIGDNVVYHEDGCIVNNKSLRTLTFGANITPSKLATHVYGNESLMNISVSEDHLSLASENGVMYDSSRTILWKYPEGRDYLDILSTVTKIGSYGLSQCMKFTGSLIMPDHIETIEDNGMFSCQYITELIFTDNSRLTTLGTRALQLLSRATNIVLPSTLKYVNGYCFSNIPLLETLHFKGTVAPGFTDITITQEGVKTITTAFGVDENSFTGVNTLSTKIVYVPANSSGYETDDWNKSIFNTERNNFMLSKSL